uniref:Uncharacterized protein n=1 Tax=Anguilla anguilla TaxID=7936 RepID=A0A0E9VWC3_ANGAN
MLYSPAFHCIKTKVNFQLIFLYFGRSYSVPRSCYNF